MKTYSKEQVAEARKILSESWGEARTLKQSEYRFLAAAYGEGRPVATAVQMALEISGLWDAYVKAGLPTWAAFRKWIKTQP